MTTIISSLSWLLNKLNGKKTTIATIAGALTVYALGRGWILQDTAEFLTVVMVALGATANVANKMQEDTLL